MSIDLFLRHKNTRAVITGGTQGLGLAVAERLAQEGAQALVITGRRAGLGEEAVAKIRALGTECHYVQADVAKVEDCQRLMATALEKMGAVNALLNSAATTDRGGLLDTTPEMWAHHMDTNVRGPFLLIQALARHLIETQTKGAIVNIITQSAHVGQSFLVPYSVSKGALVTLTKNVAQAHRSQGIRCNGIMLGWMDTPGEAAVMAKFHNAEPDWLQKAEAGRPMGQLAKPAQVAPLASYMLSPESGIMTGACVDYDQWVPGAQPE